MTGSNTRVPRTPMSKGRQSDHQQNQLIEKDSSSIKRCSSLPCGSDDKSMLPNNLNEYECDYFENPTKLFKKCEEGNWNGAIKRIERYPNEAKTWIVRKSSSDKTVSWRRLPIHEAFRRQPPKELVDLLLSAYPNGVKEKDMNDRLPVHHACVYGSTVEVMQCLLTAYPESTKAKDSWGKTAVAYLKSSFRPNRALIEVVEKGPSYYHKVAEVQVRDAIWKASVDIEMQHAEEVEVISKIAQEERDEAHQVIINLEEEISRFSDRLAASLDQENLLMKQIIELQNEIEKLHSEVAEKECDLFNGKQTNQAEIQKLKEKINDLEFEQTASKERQEEEREKLLLDIEEKKNLQTSYNKEIDALKKLVSEQETKVEQKDKQISNLNEKLKEMEIKLNEAVESMLVAENSFLEEQKLSDEDFKRFEQHIEEANAEIDALEQKLDESSKELNDIKDSSRNEKNNLMEKMRKLEESKDKMELDLMEKTRKLEDSKDKMKLETEKFEEYKVQNMKFERTVTEMKTRTKIMEETNENMKTQHLIELNSVKKNLVETQALHIEELALLDKKHSQKMNEIMASYEEKISTIQETHKQEVTSLENKFSGTIKDMEMKYDGQLFQAREENSALANDMEETVSNLKYKIEDLEASNKNIEDEVKSMERKLHAKEEELQKQIDGLQADKVEIEKEVDFLDNLLPTKDNKIEELEKEINELKKKEQELEKFRERCNEMRDQRDETEYLLYQRNRATEEERATLTEKLMEIERSKVELQSLNQQERNNTEWEKNNLRSKIVELEERLHHSNEVVENLKIEKENARIHHLDMGEEIASLKTTIDNLTKQNSHSRERISLTMTSNQDLKDALASTEAEIQQINSDMKKLQRVILSLETANEELDRELVKEKELSSMERKNIERSFNQKISELSSENSRLKSIADGYFDDLEETKARNEQIRIELQTKLEEVILEKEVIDNQMRKLQKTREKEMNDLASENSRLNERIGSLNKLIEEKEIEIIQTKDQQQTMQKKIESLDSENKKLTLVNENICNNKCEEGKKASSTPTPLKDNAGRPDNFYVRVPRNSPYNSDRSLSRRNERERGDDASTISEYSRVSCISERKESLENKFNSRYLARQRGDYVIDSESRDDAQPVKVRSISSGRSSELAPIHDRKSQMNSIGSKNQLDRVNSSSRKGRETGRSEGRSSNYASSYRSSSPSIRFRTDPFKSSMKHNNSTQIQAYPPYSSSPSHCDNNAERISSGRSSIERNNYGIDDGPSSTSGVSQYLHSLDKSESPTSMSNSERIRIKSLINKYDCQ